MSSQSSLSDLVTMREGSLTKLLLGLCTTQVCRCLYLKALVLVFIFCKSFCRISELKAICWFILFKGHFLVSVLYWPFHCIYDLKDFALQFNCRRLFMELFFCQVMLSKAYVFMIQIVNSIRSFESVPEI